MVTGLPELIHRLSNARVTVNVATTPPNAMSLQAELHIVLWAIVLVMVADETVAAADRVAAKTADLDVAEDGVVAAGTRLPTPPTAPTLQTGIALLFSVHTPPSRMNTWTWVLILLIHPE